MNFNFNFKSQSHVCRLTWSTPRSTNTMNALFSSNFQHEADPVVVESPLKFIVLIIGGSTVLVFLCTIVFVCWWNVYRKPFIKETKIFNPGIKVRSFNVIARIHFIRKRRYQLVKDSSGYCCNCDLINRRGCFNTVFKSGRKRVFAMHVPDWYATYYTHTCTIYYKYNVEGNLDYAVLGTLIKGQRFRHPGKIITH